MDPEDKARLASPPRQGLSGGKVGPKSVLRGDPGIGAAAGSPLRWLLLIVPLLVIAGVGTWLIGRWLEPAPAPIRTSARPSAASPATPASQRRPSPIEPAPDSGRGGDTAFSRPSPSSSPPPAEPTRGPLDVAAVVAAIATADAQRGATTFRICLTCHSAEPDAGHRIGPNLWGVVGRPRASQPGFAYSDAMRSRRGDWTYEDLARFLHEPRAVIPGTKMSFAGIRDPARLSDLLAHLRTVSRRPVPVPASVRR